MSPQTSVLTIFTAFILGSLATTFLACALFVAGSRLALPVHLELAGVHIANHQAMDTYVEVRHTSFGSGPCINSSNNIIINENW